MALIYTPLPPAYSPEELPDYHQSLALERSPAYAALALTSSRTSLSPSYDDWPNLVPSGRFIYSSKRLTLDLGPRQWASRLPVYGRNGLIEGHVGINSFKHVVRVELTLTGVVLTYLLSNGSPGLRSTRVVLSEKSTIWSAKSDPCSPNQCSRTFPFAFVLPDHITEPSLDSSNKPLPPSISVNTTDLYSHVFYFLQVDMFRRGIRFHESIRAEILYLPRTVSYYERPYIPLPGSEKPRRICDAEWRTAEVSRKNVQRPPKFTHTLPGLSSVIVHLSLPHKLLYPAGCDITFAVTLSGSGLSCANIPQLTAGLKLTLVKITTIIVRSIVSKKETIVSTGRICRIDEDERHWLDSKSGDNSRQVVVRGCLETGTKGRDMSWGVRGFAGVSYQVRVSLAPKAEGSDQSGSAVWEHSETVVITSHEWEGRSASGLPSLLSTAVSRTSTTISLLNGRL